MSGGRSWQGDWKARLVERVRERGYDSLTSFADARPAVPLAALAEELGAHDVNAVQVLTGLLAEAEQSHRVARFERDVLVRKLSEKLPEGWPAVMDDESRFAVAAALASWIAYTPDAHQARARKIADALLAAPPPPHWRPLGPDDERILSLLPDE